MLPLPDASEASRQSFVRSLKAVLQSEVEPGLEKIYHEKVKPEYVRQHGKEPSDRREIRQAIIQEKYFHAFGSLTRVSQELQWDTVLDSIERQLPELTERAKIAGPKLGSLRLNP